MWAPVVAPPAPHPEPAAAEAPPNEIVEDMAARIVGLEARVTGLEATIVGLEATIVGLEETIFITRRRIERLDREAAQTTLPGGEAPPAASSSNACDGRLPPDAMRRERPHDQVMKKWWAIHQWASLVAKYLQDDGAWMMVPRER